MKFKTNEMIKASFFIALGLVIPIMFHHLNMGGQIFLPMHIPVLLCGCILGKKYGAIIGFMTPLLNSMLTGMPPIYPTALSMALELATYGFISGYFYKSKNVNIILSLLIAMLLGRFVSGTANFLLLSMTGKPYAFKMFITASFVTPILGIILQLIFIPTIVKSLDKIQTRNGVTFNG
ncbi:MAG: ECF transporter S component [Clostridium sp.]|uniref:ECF transporter S component n=1 Tax=Clostridium sp. TaxID=1506 RepID=UPI003D6CA0D8